MGVAEVLEELSRDNDVEAFVRDVERLVEVGPVRLDAEPGRLGERLAIGVDADDLVPVEVRLGQGAVPTAEVEHTAPGPADVTPEQPLPLGAREDEAGTALAAVVLRIALAELFQAHGGSKVHLRR